MDKERVIALVLTPILIMVWSAFRDWLDRRAERKEQRDYFLGRAVDEPLLRLGHDGRGGGDAADGK
jgi:hypothetical protein